MYKVYLLRELQKSDLVALASRLRKKNRESGNKPRSGDRG
jgi:hypothetical protein